MKREDGFSLVEALVATAVLVAGVGALAQLAVMASQTAQRARSFTVAAIAAEQKLEQLRSLAAINGTAISPSPANALDANTSGYCDFLDAHGRPLAGATSPPADTAFVRRWALERVTADPDVLLVQVSVTSRGAEPVRLVSITTRKPAP